MKKLFSVLLFLASLSICGQDFSSDKTYTIYNAHYTAYAVYSPTYHETNVWTAGTVGDASHAVSNETYSQPFDATDAGSAWMIVEYNEDTYVYNVGAKKFLIVGIEGSSANTRLEEVPQPITVNSVEGGYVFCTTTGTKNFMCASPQLSYPISVWSKDDAGAIWQVEENDEVAADYESCLALLKANIKETVNVTIDTRNGNIFKSSTGGAIPMRVNKGETFTFSPQGISGYTCSGVTIRHGEEEYTVDCTRTIAIPATKVDGDIHITAYWERTNADAPVLVFSDEFNGTGEPSKKWWSRTNRQGATWNRWCSESPLVVYEKDGSLHCLAIPNPDKTADNVDMLTGGIKTQGKFSFQWGRAEARLKTNQWTGNFPAFWMMPADNSAGWPNAGEIDIWETIDTQTQSWHTVHTNWTWNLKKGGNTQSKGGMDYSTWHVYAVEWDATSITWYADGSKVWTYYKSTDQTALDNKQWPFDAPFYLILNQSVGNGAWAANADITHTYETEFDWVRVYQPVELTDVEIPLVNPESHTPRNTYMVNPWVKIIDGKKYLAK